MTANHGTALLVDRDPFSSDYERARDLLGHHFPHGHTASTLLGQYRDGLIDLTTIAIDVPAGSPLSLDGEPTTLTRLIVTTSPKARLAAAG